MIEIEKKISKKTTYEDVTKKKETANSKFKGKSSFC
jgi:hypothetical protein